MGIKEKVLQILALDVIIRFAEVLGKKYRLIPAGTAGTKDFVILTLSIRIKNCVPNHGSGSRYIVHSSARKNI